MVIHFLAILHFDLTEKTIKRKVKKNSWKHNGYALISWISLRFGRKFVICVYLKVPLLCSRSSDAFEDPRLRPSEVEIHEPPALLASDPCRDRPFRRERWSLRLRIRKLLRLFQRLRPSRKWQPPRLRRRLLLSLIRRLLRLMRLAEVDYHCCQNFPKERSLL